MDSTSDAAGQGQGSHKRRRAQPEPEEPPVLPSPGSATTSTTTASPAGSLAHNGVGVSGGDGGGGTSQKRQRTGGGAGAAVGDGRGAASTGAGGTGAVPAPAVATGPGLRFDGTGFHLTRLAGEQQQQPGGGGGGGVGGNGVGDAPARPSTLSLAELLEPRERLAHVLLITGTINPSWTITRGLGNMPPSLVSPPVLIYHSSNDATTNADGRRPSVQSVLRAASPLLPPGKQWQVLKLQGKGRKGSGNGAMQHAKLFLLRFGPAAGGGGGDGGGGGGGDNGFLRVVIGSVNLYCQWEHSRDVMWIQDFPIAANYVAPTPAPPLPTPASDPEQLRRTLHCFCLALFRAVTNPLDGGLAIEKSLKQRLAVLFGGVSTADARATALASIPPTVRLNDGAYALPAKWNGLAGLATALASVGWSAAAADAPVTALAGSLGDPSHAAWVAELGRAMTGNGAHGQLTLAGEDPALRILFPTNLTAFSSDPTVHCCLSHGYYYDESKPFPHRLMWQLEAKPGSWPAGALPPVQHAKIMWRVAPAAFGKAKRKAQAAPGLPRPKSEVRGWMIFGSHNISKAAWGESTENPKPSNFELSCLLLTRDPARAAAWLEHLPMKLPPQPGVTVRNLVPAERYPSSVTYTRQAPFALFTYAKAKPAVRDEARAAIMGVGMM